jgi:hypothetical protein
MTNKREGAEARGKGAGGLLRNLLGGALEELVDQSLIGLGLLGGEAAKLGEKTRSDESKRREISSSPKT